MTQFPTKRVLLGVFERLALHPESGTVSVLVVAPIREHATAITALGPDAMTVRGAGVDPDPHCTVAVLSVERPEHPDTDEIAIARACLAVIEGLQARGELRDIARELEVRSTLIAKTAREDRLQSTARRGPAH